MPKEDNPHEIIKLIGKPQKWREKASIILIKLWEDNRKIEQRQNAILALLIFTISLLLKIIFLP